MRILIDGDACPVLRETERQARRYGVECHVYCDTSRVMESRYSSVHVVDKGHDAADFAIVGACRKGDLVVTADGGLAAMALTRGARVLNPFGGEYTDDNIMQVLYRRRPHAGTSRRHGCRKDWQPSGPSPLRGKETYGDGLRRIIRQSMDEN